jgi:hypothetical protein
LRTVFKKIKVLYFAAENYDKGIAEISQRFLAKKTCPAHQNLALKTEGEDNGKDSYSHNKSRAPEFMG